MNREIKFRAWDKHIGEMHSTWHPNYFYDWVIDEDFLLMQYTGLKDKNGKEIYFGDILQTSNDGADGSDIWDKDDFGFSICYEDPIKLGVRFKNWTPSYDEESIYNVKYCEIIGNIYENSELIEVVTS